MSTTTYDATHDREVADFALQPNARRVLALFGHGSENIGGRHLRGDELARHRLKESLADGMAVHANEIAQRTDRRAIVRVLLPLGALACAVTIALVIAGRAG